MKTSTVQTSAIVFITLLIIIHPINSRYLPTRSQGNDLDKLRELMIDILDSSNENQESTNIHHNNINDIEQPSSKLTSNQRLSLARNLFGGSGNSKDDSELLAAYLNRYASTGTGTSTSHRNINNSLNKLYGRIQY